MSNVYVGIDPGLSGSVATITKDNIIVADVPTIMTKTSTKKNKRQYDVVGMVSLLRDLPINSIIGLEKIHSMPGQGVASTFSTGEGYGIWKGIIAALGFSLVLITPQAWKKAMMNGMGKGKEADRLRAIEMFPELHDKLRLKSHHNRADALLIAEYTRRISA